MNGGLYEQVPAGKGQPIPPAPLGASRQSPQVAPVVSAPSSNYRTGPVGTSVSTSSQGGNVKLAQPASTSRKPSSGLQPTLIGPLGYDDLR